MRSLVVLCLFASIVLAPSGSAHGETIVHGRYALTLGWLVEPPVVDAENALYLKIVDQAVQEGPAGVTHAHQTVRVELAFENASGVFEFKPHNSMEGEFVSRFVPTALGTYNARVFGSLGGENFTHAQKLETVRASRLAQWPTEGPSSREAVALLASKDAWIATQNETIEGLRSDLAAARAEAATMQGHVADLEDELERRVPSTGLGGVVVALLAAVFLTRRP